MSMRVSIGIEQFEPLRDALSLPEQVVFAYATHDDGRLEVNALEEMTGRDIASPSLRHVVLADDVRPRVIKTAWDRNECLIEAHSHGPRGHAEFSPSDLLGFEEWVPHVTWRLRGRPYAALVVAGDKWDALVWIDRAPVAPAAIEITDGGRVIDALRITGATATRLATRGDT
jgi:hypothetical protein